MSNVLGVHAELEVWFQLASKSKRECVLLRRQFGKVFQKQQDNVQENTKFVQCISIAYSEVHITEISEQLSRVDQSG